MAARAVREAVLEQVAAEVLRARGPGVTRVAIDGVDGAGKTVFGDELAAVLRPSGREVVRASVDDFHNPRGVRHRSGRDSPDGFLLDSYDYDALRRLLLEPLAPGGSRRFRRRAFDLGDDRAVSAPVEVAAGDAILILDGIFLHRPELRECWDYSVFLDVAFEVSVARAASRDDNTASPDPDAASNRRYVVGQQRYLSECEPLRHATRVIDNTSLETPIVIR